MQNVEINALLKEERQFDPPSSFKKEARISTLEEYEQLYRHSIENPEQFWASQAEANLHWYKKWKQVFSWDFHSIGITQFPFVRYFEGGELNVSDNCLDRHLHSHRRNKAAILWQGERREEKRVITYLQLHREVCRFANVLRKHGVMKGTAVTIFMPMIPESTIAMLACARIGAVHSFVFSAFSAHALRERVEDCGSEIILTTDYSYYGGRSIALKEKVDDALRSVKNIKRVIVYRRGDGKIEMQPGRDVWWQTETTAQDIKDSCQAEVMQAEDPLFILYTSGSTGKPKAITHTSAGYLLYAHLTFKYVFDYQESDIYWCTADLGWIAGHSYGVYGPLSNGATLLMYEGTPTYPLPDRFWEIIEDHQVNVMYTAPTAIRALMRLGDEWPAARDLSSLRLLGSVGEPINPKAWMWYFEVVGKKRCPIVDTWWQTETGGIMITTLPGVHSMKPGVAGKPFFGIVPDVLNDDGKSCEMGQGGSLVITHPWPAMFRGMYRDRQHELTKRTYFSHFPGVYFAGDGACQDQDGHYRLMGRLDDVINVAAHRLSAAEIESALVSHKAVAEAAVVAMPHETKGQGIYCFVTLKESESSTEELKQALVCHVRDQISPIATPHYVHFTPALPKTRSGKIMRRILRKIAAGQEGEIGDTSTLADPSLIDALIKGRQSASAEANL